MKSSYEFQASLDEWGRGYKAPPRQLDAEGNLVDDKLNPGEEKKKSGNDKQKPGDDERRSRRTTASCKSIAWRPGPTR